MTMTILPPGPAIRVEKLGKRFLIGVKAEKESFFGTTRRLVTGWTRHRELWALHDVTFSVEHGETLGIIGPNGAGKSTLLLLLAQILAPTEGTCQVSSKTHCFFRLGAALQPRLTVLDNFSLCSALLGLDRSEFRRRLPAMIAYSGLEDYQYARYGELSSGLAARLPFAAAIHTDLDIILVDEMLMVGDQNFQAKCLKTFRDLKEQKKTLIMVSHNLQQIESLCSRTLYLDEGKIAFLGDTSSAVRMHVRDVGKGAPARPARGGYPEQDGRPFSGRMKAVVEKGVEKLYLELKRSQPEGRVPGAREERSVTEHEDALLGEVRKIVEAEAHLLRSEVRASMNEPGPAAAQERENRADSAKPRPETVPCASPPGGPEVELAWRRLLGHKGPLAVCSSVPAAFAAVLESLMTGEKRLKPGDEVILNAGIWPGIFGGLLGCGLVPVFVDRDPRTWSMDIAQLPRALSGRTRAVILSHGSTCAPVDQAAAFCVQHDLRLVEFVHSAALAGRYDGKFLGTLGDYGVYSPGRPVNSSWGLALARGENSSALFSRMPSAAADRSGGGAEAGSFIPFKAAGRALAASLDTCRNWEAQLPDLEAGFACYVGFFGALSGYFAVLEPPPAARLASLYFTLVVRPGAPFTVQELLEADLENKARRWIIEYPEDRRRVRQVNALPHTMELGARGVTFPVLRDAGARERFFGEFGEWLKNRAGSSSRPYRRRPRS